MGLSNYKISCHLFVGMGDNDGKDLSMELRMDGLLIYECNFGKNINCEVRKIALMMQGYCNIDNEIGIYTSGSYLYNTEGELKF
jgi:hypothetical protein